MTGTGVPVVEPPFERDGRRDDGGTVVGVVLAAGTSSRFGERNKLLAEWRGAPIVTHATRTLCASRVDTTVVVLGHEAARVRAAVETDGVQFAYNARYRTGQASSVQRGVAASREAGADAVVFALGDMPAVSAETVDRLHTAYRAVDATALAAASDGSRGNPVLFDAVHFDALSAVSGDVGGRDVFLSAEDSALVETGDSGVTFDVDTTADI